MIPAYIELKNKKLLLDYELFSKIEEVPLLAIAIDNALLENKDLAFAANLCVEELITNTIQHGLSGASDRIIKVRISISDEWLEIMLHDDAPKFDPFTDTPQPDLDLDIEQRHVGGLGIYMTKSIMDKVYAFYDGSGNLIILLKMLKSNFNEE